MRNLALKNVWKAFIQTKVGFLTFEKAKVMVNVKNTRAEKEVSDLYHMEDWDIEPEAEAIIQNMLGKKKNGYSYRKD